MAKDKPIRVGKRMVGVVRGSYFVKNVHGSKHFMRIPPAIAFDLSSIKNAEDNGAIVAMIVDKETGREYFSYIKYIYEKGFKFNRGYGEQIALAMEYWTSREELSSQARLFE